MHLDQILPSIFILLTVAALFIALSTHVGLGSILGLLATGCWRAWGISWVESQQPTNVIPEQK